MSFFFRILITFLAITGAVAIATSLWGIQLGHEDYWHHHGFVFLVFIAMFPRLTLLFSSVASGGLLWWLSWIFVPRILVAVLATITYWNQNPFLVIAAWLIAMGGESSEKYVVIHRSTIRRGHHKNSKTWDADYKKLN
ncbi:MAG: hypothetical protein AB7F43_06855 [Bacteriovoracia bacterium]